MQDKKTLEKQMSHTKREISNTKTEITNISDKIDRLNAVKKSIKEYKQEANGMVKDAKKNYKWMEDNESWKGRVKNSLTSLAEDGVYKEYKCYYDRADDRYDLLVDEITRLENKLYEKEGLLGRLKIAINNIGSAIDKLL